MKKRIISMAVAFVLMVTNASMAFALSPVAEVYYNVGTSSHGDSDFESKLNEAIKAKLKAAGINPKYMSIMDASANPATVTDTSYVHKGQDSWYMGPIPEVETADYNHVQISNNGKALTFYGYTMPGYKDFMLTGGSPAGKKIITFDMDESKVNYHSMEGGGFLFNSKIDSDGKLSGYTILYVSNAIEVYKLDGVDATAFHNEAGSGLRFIQGVSLVQSFSKGTSAQHSIKIVATDTQLNMWDNGDQIIINLALPQVYGDEFGPIVSHVGHGCEIISIFAFDNMKLFSTSPKDVNVAVNDIVWDPYSPYRYVVNLNDDPRVNLDGGTNESDLKDKLNNNGAQYIGVTESTYKDIEDDFIDGLPHGGLHLDSEKTTDEIIEEIAERVANAVIAKKDAIEAVEQAEELTTISYEPGDNKNSVKGNLTLLPNDEDIVWSADDPSIIAPDGTVTRPAIEQKGTYVNLTAKITKGGLTSEKTFTVYVLAAEPESLKTLSAVPGNGQVTLKFPALKGATNIVVEQSTNGTDFSPVNPLEKLDATSTSATVTGLTNGQTYYFRLIVESGLYEGVSDPVEVSPSETLTTLSAVPDNGQVTLKFPALTGATSIGVEQSTDGTNFTPVSPKETLTATSTSATVTGLTNGTTYYFRLNIISGQYAGLSNVVNAKPSAPYVPGPSVPAPSEPAQAPTPAPSVPAVEQPTMKAEVIVSDQANGGKVVQDKITKLVGDNLKVSGKIKSADGKELNLPNLVMNKDGSFTLPKLAAGEYQLSLNVFAPNGEKLAGPAGKVIVDSKGNAKVSVDLVDPYGTILDKVTGQPVEGMNMQLFWADTALNRSKGRVPGALVQLPELPEFLPNQNHNPQLSSDKGQYGWMVYADGDYYFLGEKNGYVLFDSRTDKREERFGSNSYIKDGIIHVGDTIVKFDFSAQPKVKAAGDHKAYMVGYPDGTFRTDRGIIRAEVAAILSRLYTSAGGTSKVSYSDVSAKHWAGNAIQTATRNNWMVGFNDHTFKPKKQITRAEFMQILMNINKWDAAENSTYTDVAGHWAEQAIAAAQEQGLLFDFTEKKFNPNKPITRVEVVRMLNELLDRKPWDIMVEPKWTDIPEDHKNYADIMEASIPHSFEQLETGVENWK
ncbi:S-layer homology domain-containing protein [Paenibacillus solani]|uniref:S-layer protein n=1 Tax=Paenibacillus solani TaxID=1705565 RepID=A0A0M1N3P5_9BACL|nr:S-layer homology domain-containing protein [Paenibacillus solani]KOR76589.1 S-layer protein [Paenibacillus solani]